MFKDYISFFFKKFKKQKSHSIYIISGVSITIATIVLIQSLLTERANPENIVKFPERMVINDYCARYDTTGSNWTGSLNYKLIKDVIFKSNLQEKSSVYSGANFQLWVNDERISCSALFSDANFFSFFNFKILRGRVFTEDDVDREAKVILVDKETSLKVYGTIESIDKEMDIYGIRYKVIGVFEKFPQMEFADFEVMTPITNDLLKNRETTVNEASYDYSAISLLKSIGDYKSFKQEIVSNAKTFPVRPEGFDIQLLPYTISEHYFSKRYPHRKEWSLINDSEWQFLLSSLLLITILSTICLINITNLSVTSYLNRNMELGVRYAFGATWKDTLKQSLAESTIYISAIFICSSILSFLFLSTINTLEYYPKMNFNLSIISFLIIAAYSIFFPLIANVLSIVKLSKVYPIHLLKGILS